MNSKTAPKPHKVWGLEIYSEPTTIRAVNNHALLVKIPEPERGILHVPHEDWQRGTQIRLIVYLSQHHKRQNAHCKHIYVVQFSLELKKGIE